MPHVPPRILLVEDEPLLARAFSRRLAPTFAVTWVKTLAEAQAILVAERGGFDAWVLDRELPDGFGPSLLDWFASSSPTERCPPVAVWSGSPEPEQGWIRPGVPHFSKRQLQGLAAWLRERLGPAD